MIAVQTNQHEACQRYCGLPESRTHSAETRGPSIPFDYRRAHSSNQRDHRQQEADSSPEDAFRTVQLGRSIEDVAIRQEARLSRSMKRAQRHLREKDRGTRSRGDEDRIPAGNHFAITVQTAATAIDRMTAPITACVASSDRT